MNKLNRTCAVAIVTAVLAVRAFAGIMDSPGTPAPAPTPSQTSSNVTGTIDSPGVVATPSETFRYGVDPPVEVDSAPLLAARVC